MKLLKMSSLNRLFPFLEYFIRKELQSSPEHFLGGHIFDMRITSRAEAEQFIRRENAQQFHVFFVTATGVVVAHLPFGKSVLPPPEKQLASDWLEQSEYVVFYHPGTSEGEGEDLHLRIYLMP